MSKNKSGKSQKGGAKAEPTRSPEPAGSTEAPRSSEPSKAQPPSVSAPSPSIPSPAGVPPTKASSRVVRTLEHGTNAIVGTVLLLVILVSVNWFANTSQIRLDLTATQQFTVSPVTTRLLSQIDDIITVNVYATRRNTPPDWTRQREELIALLSEYRRLSGGRLNFTIKDPASDPKIEQEARNAGVQEEVMQDVTMQEIRARAGYLGLQVLYRGKSETIPVLQPAVPIEYQLTRAIGRVASLNNPVIGILAPQGNPFMNEPGFYQLIGRALDIEGFQSRILDPEKLGDISRPNTDVRMVMVFDPEDFSEEALFHIDQFVMNGGKLFVAAQGVKLEGTGRVPRAVSRAPNIQSILEHYGLRLNQDIVEDWGRGTEQQFLTNRGIVSTINPFILRVTDLGPSSVDIEAMDPGTSPSRRANRSIPQVETGSPITDQLPALAFLFSSTVGLSDVGTSASVQVLARSSARTRIQEGFFNLDQSRLRPPAEGSSDLGRRDLIVSVSATEQNRLRSRFAVVDPPVLTNDDGTTRAVLTSEIRTESAPSAQVIVASATLPFMDNILQQAPSNLFLLLNMADVLTRDGSMVNLRNRSQVFPSLRPDISEREITIAHFVVIGVVPVLLLLFGILRSVWGRIVRSHHRRVYGGSSS